jgi:hypothetical protein
MAPALGPTGLSDLLRGLPQWCGDGHGARELQRLAQTIVEPIAQATALEGARAVRSEGDRVHALLAIAGKLNGPHQREVVAMLAATPFTAERTRRLLAVRPGLKPDAILAWNEAAATVTHAELAEMLEQASSRSDEPPPQQSALAGPPHDRRLDALIAALPMHRPHEPNRESAPVAAPPTHGVSVLLRRMALLEAEADRHASLMQALPGLSPGQRATVLEQLPVHFGFERRAQILVDMAPGLGDADRSAWVSQLIAIDRTALLETILLEARPPDRDALRGELLQALRDAMQRHDGIDRPGFLRLLGAWAPAVVTIGGEDAAVQMIQAIDEFGRAWH